MDLWEIYKASKGVPHSGDLYDALMGKSLGGGSVWETESVPYLFRQSGGALNSRLLGKEKDTIVGASVGWNQLVKDPTLATNASGTNGTFSASNGIASLTANGNSNSYFIITSTLPKANHIILLSCDVMLDSNNANDYAQTTLITSWTGGFKAVANPTKGTWKTMSVIVKPSADPSTFAIYTFGTATTASGEKAYIRNPMYVDLTLLLGSAIADYAYTLESGTAGAGIAWLRSFGFFPTDKPYFAYDSGSLQSVNATKKITTGKNLCDGMVYDGYVPSISNGALVLYHGTHSDYIRVLPNTAYTASFDYSVFNVIVEYDSNKTFIKATSGTPATVTTTATTAYVMLRSDLPSGTDTPSWAQLEFGSTATAYEPYSAHEYSLADLELRGVFKMDASHNIYADGDTYESSGVVTRKYGVVNLGDWNWIKGNANDDGTGFIFRHSLGNVRNNQGAICDKFVTVIVPSRWEEMHLGEMCMPVSYVCFCANYADADAFKTAMNGVYLVYELATPTTENATPFTSPQSVSREGTEQYIDGKVASGTRDVAVPVGHETEYKCSPIT